MCLYVLHEKCTGVQKNSAFGALCEASGAFRICGANISGRRYFARCAEMNFMEKGPAEKQVLFLSMGYKKDILPFSRMNSNPHTLYHSIPLFNWA